MVDNNSVSDSKQDVSGDLDINGTSEDKKEVVSYDTHKKLLGQRKADQLKLKQLEEQLESFTQKQQQAEEAKLAEQGEYKKILSVREEELRKERELRQSTEKQINDAYKLNAFYSKLPGKIPRKEYLSFVDLDSIALNPETRDVDMESVQQVVNRFMEDHPTLVKLNDDRRLPADAPKNNSPSTYAEALRQCKSQRELDEVRRKFNRPSYN